MELDAEIIGPPKPRDDGYVVFTVRVGLDEVSVMASPLGIGVLSEVPLEITNAATNVAWQYMRSHRTELLDLYRKAARMRRQAGNPPLVERGMSVLAQLEGPPKRSGKASVFTARVDGVEI